MNVIFLPYSGKNPYQRELAQALERKGASVNISEGRGWLPFLSAIRTHGKSDILHLHWSHDLFVSTSGIKTILRAFRFLAELLIVKALGIKVVWTVHNLLEHKRRRPGLEFFFTCILVRFCDQIIVHCSSARDTVIRTYRLPDRLKDKIHVIPHGHYIDSYQNQLTREQARTKLDLGKEDVIFLYFGLIHPYKGIPQLISAFRKLDRPQIRLLIVGKPGNQAIRSELIRSYQLYKRIHTFLQFVPDEEVQVYMNAADVVVLPYQDILTSGGILLAMSFGKPVVAPNMGCIPEILDTQGGFLYDPDKEDGLLRTMQESLSADLAKMGQHNRDKAERFNWDKIAQMTFTVYCLR